MESIFAKVKDSVDIQLVVEAFGVKLNRMGKGLCPFHNEKTPSFSIKKDDNTWHCFGCGEGGDAIDFVSKIKGKDGKAAAELLADMFSIRVDDAPKPQKSTKIDIPKYIKECIQQVDKNDYFKRRGLTAETIKRFSLGYDAMRDAVVIPYDRSLTYYQTRGVKEKVFFKPRTEDAGAEPLFNAACLTQKTKRPVFVVESPICAMSIVQCGGEAVSTCGTGGVRKLLTAVKSKKPTGPIVICMDNDAPGEKARDDLANGLFELGVKFLAFNIAKDCKDPNELLMKDPKQLEQAIQDAKLAVRKKYATAKDSFDSYELATEVIEPTTWIVDEVLPTGLAFLCAPSKYGKSWMVLQLALCVAQGKDFLKYKTHKYDCLYFALEDGKDRLQDRQNKMLKGKPPVRGAHFTLKADSLETGLLEKIQEEMDTFPNIKLVIIDTLQKVRAKMAKTDTLYANEYREMAAVKDFADKYKICILFVHHLRKMADEADVYNMISGSTALMGAADTVLILSKKKRKDENATLSMTGRDIQQNDIVVAFDKADHIWKVEGTAEEIADRKEREEYELNPCIQTIKELVKANPISGWSGSAEDLRKAVYDVTGKVIADSPTAIGKLISRFEYKLYCDDIEHKAAKSGARKHTFTKRLPYKPTYQRTIYDADND